MRPVIAILFSILLLAGCEETFEKKVLEEESKLVVESVITNELKNQRVKLSLSTGQPNQSPLPVAGALVRISDGFEIFNTLEFPSGSGEYFTREFRAVSGRTYTLQIEFMNKVYTAQDRSVGVEPLIPLQYVQVNNQFRILFPNSGQEPSYTDHFINWVNTGGCVTGTCIARTISYDLKAIDVNEIFKPEQEEVIVPYGTRVIRRKYSVSAPYREFLRGMLSETAWRGGVFDVQRANATTNLSNGAVGFFAVSTVVSDTTFVTR